MTLDLLDEARANGLRRDVRGLSVFRATVQPIEPNHGRGRVIVPGQSVTVETVGRDLSYREAGRLIDFAAERLGAGP